MAAPSVILQYWDGTTWVKAVTHAGNSAVLICSVTKSLNNPAAAEVILSNRSKDPTATDNDARGSLSDHDGTRATLFREFQDVRLIDNETGICFFRGRLYHIRNQYDFQYGNTVKIVAKDMLQELVDVPIDNAPPPLRSITLDSNANSRSKIIGKLVNGLSRNFITTDSTKFEASAHVFTADEMKTGDPSFYNTGTASQSGTTVTGSGTVWTAKMIGETFTFTGGGGGGTITARASDTSITVSVSATVSSGAYTISGGIYVWDIATGQQQALALINDFAKQDPHDANTDTDHFGYDYHVDANVVSYALSSNADSGKVPFNYFKRGSRPHATNIPDYGVTLEYPSAGWGGQTGFRKAMLSDAEFTNPNGAFFTSILAHFEDKGSTEDKSNRKIHGVDNYELVRGNIVGDFPWEVRRIQYIDDGEVKDGDNSEEDNRRINETTSNVTNSDSETIYPGQSMNTDNPMFLFESSQAIPCATVHYQSGIGSNGTYNAEFLVLSNVYNTDTTWTDPQGNKIRFKAFPANPANSSTVVRLHLAKSQGTTGTTYPYIIITKDARSTDKYDINKPHRVHIRDLESYDSIRKSMAGILDRASRTSVTLGKARTSRYPYTKVIAATGSSLNSRSSNTITLGTNTFKDAAGDAAGNDPTVFGAKIGMVVAQLAGANEGTSAIARYSYISALPASNQVTYGSSATDTSDGTAFDVAKDLAFFIPTEVGHKVHLKNNLYGVDYDVIVQKISFEYSPGVLTTTVEGVGVNNNTAGGVAIVPSDAINVSIVGGEEDKGYSFNLPSHGQVWEITDGTIAPYSAGHIVIDSNKAAKTVTLKTSGDGKSYQVDVANQSSVGGYDYDRLEIGATSGSGGGHADFVHSNIDDTGPYVLFFRTKGEVYKSRKIQAIAVRRKIQSGTTRYATGGKIYSEIESSDDIIIGDAEKDSVGGLCVLNINGGAFGSGWPMDITAIGRNRMTHALMKKGAQPFTTNLEFSGYPATSSGDDSVYNKFRWQGSALQANGTPTTANAGRISFGDSTIADDDITIIDGHSDANFISLGGENYSSGLSASTTYYAFLTIPTSGNASVGVTNDWKVPFQDDKVLLATVTVAPSAPNNANSKGATPAILPIAGKQATLSAVNISANTILADHITAGSITAAKLESDLVIANNFLTAGSVGTGGGPAGIKISSAGIEGFSGGTTRGFFLNPATGTVTVGGGQDGQDGSDGADGTDGSDANVPDWVPDTIYGVTMDPNGFMYSGSKDTFYSSGTTIDTTAGWFIGFDANNNVNSPLGGSRKAVLAIGAGSKYLTWNGENLEIVGGLTVGSGNTIATDAADNTGIKMTTGDMSIYNTYAGRVAFYDENAAISLRIRVHSYYNQFDTFGRGTWWLQTDRSGESSTTVATAQDSNAYHTWTYPSNHFSPGIGNGKTYLGSPSDGGSSPNDYGIGWKALVLGNNSNNGALVLQSHATTTRQYRFTFPQAPATSSGYQLASDLTGATSWTSASSSLRYKENIRPLEIDSSKIYKLDPKSFNLIEGHVSALGNAKFGYIAEEVDKVLPEVVRYDNEDRPDSLNYQLLTVFLIEEIKKLRSRIEVLEEK